MDNKEKIIEVLRNHQVKPEDVARFVQDVNARESEFKKNTASQKPTHQDSLRYYNV